MNITQSNETRSAQTTSTKSPPKKGFFFGVIIFVCVILVLGTVSVFAYYRLMNSAAAAPIDLIFETVKRGVFVHEVTDRGNVESAQNEDIRCQVESPSGTLIVWIIPEGTFVEQGEILCQLDSSNLDEKVAAQEITVTNSRATLAQSEADLKIAELARDEYLPRDPEQQGLKGVFHQEEKTIENKILKAEEDLSTATQTRLYTEKLLAQGYVTDLQLKADKAKEEQLQNDLESARLELEVLEKYTKAKTLEQLDAAIVTAAAKRESDQRRYEIDMNRLEYYNTQLKNCTIKAPKAGQVVYATPNNPWRRDSDVIKEGNSVRDRQTIIRLPDPRQMQVAGMVNEASVSQVKVGQPATITLEAMPSHVFHGTVKQVNDYPEPDGHMGSMTKEYKTIVSMDDLDSLPPGIRGGIRPGLTAQIRIDVTNPNDETMPILVPVQTLFEHAGQYYCITCDNGVWDKVSVEVGTTNDKEVIIKSGLSEGMRIVQGAWRYIDYVLSEEERAGAKEFGVGGARQRRGPGGPAGGPGGDATGGTPTGGPGAAPAVGGPDMGNAPGAGRPEIGGAEAPPVGGPVRENGAGPIPGNDGPGGERPRRERPNAERPTDANPPSTPSQGPPAQP